MALASGLMDRAARSLRSAWRTASPTLARAAVARASAAR